MSADWDARIDAWRAELELLARAEGTTWVSLAEAEAEAGVSRSALRAWYRNGEIASRLVDDRLQRHEALLRNRVDHLEIRLAALERR